MATFRTQFILQQFIRSNGTLMSLKTAPPNSPDETTIKPGMPVRPGELVREVVLYKRETIQDFESGDLTPTTTDVLKETHRFTPDPRGVVIYEVGTKVTDLLVRMAGEPTPKARPIAYIGKQGCFISESDHVADGNVSEALTWAVRRGAALFKYGLGI